MNATREDIIAAYKIFLNRLPESSLVLDARVGKSMEETLIEFALSDEFLARPDVVGIIQKAAKTLSQKAESNS